MADGHSLLPRCATSSVEENTRRELLNTKVENIVFMRLREGTIDTPYSRPKTWKLQAVFQEPGIFELIPSS